MNIYKINLISYNNWLIYNKPLICNKLYYQLILFSLIYTYLINFKKIVISYNKSLIIIIIIIYVALLNF